MTEEESNTYKIMADYKKATYQKEQWANNLKNGRYNFICIGS